MTPQVASVSFIFSKFQNRFIETLQNQYSSVCREEIEDLYQDTFIIVVENLKNGKVAMEANWWGYIITVGRNQLSKRLRKKSISNLNEQDGNYSKSNKHDEEELQMVEDAQDNLNNDRWEIVETILSQFPEKAAAVITDKYFENLSDKEIAEKRNFANAATVKAKRCQIMKKIKEGLKDRVA
ncbi:MAG: sigma-70 family RNA polymerase sigma factor [Muribaculaceae bacterium]|nr:sigma-70 family RNA polymerase sigma factor [Muribaculaceae bacterium]